MCIRALLILTLVVAVAVVVHRPIAGDDAALPPAAESTPDAAAALRSLSGAAPPAKPWIADFAGFCASHPGRWIVGRCARPCLSQAEAEQSARSDAARAVYAVALDQFAPGRGDEKWLAGQVMADVRAGALASDDLPEKFDRPYGTVWTKTVLLDASPAKLQPLVDRYRSDLSQRRARMTAVRFVAVAFALSGWIAYLLINAITKGYFTLRLRLAAGTITAAALLVLLGGP
jgi:hypothetical protein